MDKQTYITAFKTALKRLNLTIYLQQGNHYILIHGNDSSRIVSVQLISTTKINSIHKSRNNNSIQSIGHFKFFIPKCEDKINFYAFAFENTLTKEVDSPVSAMKFYEVDLENKTEFPIPERRLNSHFGKCHTILYMIAQILVLRVSGIT